MRWLWKLLLYCWASPASLLGLAAALLSLVSGGRVRAERGAIEVHGGFAAWFLCRAVPRAGGASALTLGHVILGRDRDCLDTCREHEHVHVRQFERWGPFMIPLYLAASVVEQCRGRHPYLDNPFEREAFDYVDRLNCPRK